MTNKNDNINAQELTFSLIDTLAFAEWIDINCVRNGKHQWTYRGDNFKSDYTTKQLYVIYYKQTTN